MKSIQECWDGYVLYCTNLDDDYQSIVGVIFLSIVYCLFLFFGVVVVMRTEIENWLAWSVVIQRLVGGLIRFSRMKSTIDRYDVVVVE